jgi:outer membrane protein assembly factor BamB
MPAVADDGTLYLSYRVRNSTESTNCLAAVSPDGTLKWQHYSDLRPDSIVLTDDGGVLVITAGGVSSFGSDGALQWEAESSSPLSRRSSITRDGHLLVASATYAYPEPVHSAMLCLAPDGQWVADRQLDFPAGIYLYDVVSDDEGRFYLAQAALYEEEGELAEQTGVFAYSESGELLWQYFTEEPAGGLAIGSDKTLYFTSNSRLYALAD